MTHPKPKLITFLGQTAKVNCDRNCRKAWGRSQRPRVQLSDDEDDFAWMSDGELPDAPADPGTSEGRDIKPASPLEFPNKWCVRECERCAMSAPREYFLPLELPSFENRVPNILEEG